MTDVAQRIKTLELEADAHHQVAQRSNKEGRFAAAKDAYAAMHAAEDEASRLAREAGLQDGTPRHGSTDDAYTRLHPVAALPAELSSAGRSDRLVGCIAGSLLADAAAMGVHWVYDMAALDKLQEQATSQGLSGLAFYDPPQSPFYSYASGRNSPYGEQTMVLLESVAERGGLDCQHYAQAFQDRLGAAGYDGYLDVSSKGFLRNFGAGERPPASGAVDSQANCTARLAPLIAGFAGDARLLPTVQLATRVTQNTDAAAAWGGVGAAILESIVLGAQPSQAVEAAVQELTTGTGGRFEYMGDFRNEISAALQHAVQLASRPPPEAFLELGRNCHMPTALQTPLHIVLHVEHLIRIANHSANGAGPGGATSATAGSASKPDGARTASAAATAATSHPDINTTSAEASNSGHTASPPGSEDVAQEPSSMEPDWFRIGIELAARQGGCSASRSSYAGACLGAMVGLRGLDASWAAKYPLHGDVVRLARSIVEARSA